jgi:hypothetical protein
MTDARNFSVNTDSPIDQLMFLASGSATVSNGTTDFIPGISVAHSLPFAPLPLLTWSNTSDFAIVNIWFDAAVSSTFFTTATGQQYEISADTTNVKINRYNTSGSDKTLYYRFICFAPSDADVDSEVLETATNDNGFILNTDNNYMKLGFIGKLVDSTPFSHNLGYTPRVLAWQKTGTSYSPIIAASLVDTDATGAGGQTEGLYIDDTVIKWLNPSTYDEIEYRIYMES